MTKKMQRERERNTRFCLLCIIIDFQKHYIELIQIHGNPPTLSPSLRQSAEYARLLSLAQRLGSPALSSGWPWGSWAVRWKGLIKELPLVQATATWIQQPVLAAEQGRLQSSYSHWKPFCLASVFPCKSVTTIAAVHELMQKYYRANADFRVKKDPQTTVHQGKRNQQTTNPRVSMTLIQADYCFSIHCVWLFCSVLPLPDFTLLGLSALPDFNLLDLSALTNILARSSKCYLVPYHQECMHPLLKRC